MSRFSCSVAAMFLVIAVGEVSAQESSKSTLAPTDWPWWRGPTRNGVAVSGQQPPLKWSGTENVLWKGEVPGRGHGSPTVVGDQVFLATAEHDTEIQSVLCYDRRSGKRLWQTEVHRGGFDKKGLNGKSSLASSTIACDGERLFINFTNAGGVHTTALSRDGKILWQKKVSKYVLHQGFGSSPAVYQSLVIVGADNKGGGAIVGLDRATGDVVWTVSRPSLPNYASPIVLHVAGRDQVLLTGCDLVTSLDPLKGTKLWETKGSTTECVTSPVTDGVHIFTSGGFPKGHMSAVRADGSAKIAWETSTRVYVPSLLERGGYLYGVQDNGFAGCWRCDTGKEVWKARLSGAFTASPVLVGDRIFATSEAGRTFLFKASPDAFELLGENQLGDEAMATPTFCGNRVYFRVAHQTKGKRQEMLYCVGE